MRARGGSMLGAMPDESKGIMRSLGEFFGHIARGIASDGRPPSRRTVISEETTEQEKTAADGQRVILRRTVVEEVEFAPDRTVVPGDDESPKGATP